MLQFYPQTPTPKQSAYLYDYANHVKSKSERWHGKKAPFTVRASVYNLSRDKSSHFIYNMYRHTLYIEQYSI